MPASPDPTRGDAPRSGVHPSVTPVTRVDFDALFTELATWREWSDLDRGAWNRVTQETVLGGSALVKTGRTAQTALPWNTVAGIDNHRPALHHMTDLGDREAPEPSTYKDFLGVDYHGKAVSHLDALAHIAYRGQLFGGVDSRRSVDATGAHVGSVAALGHFVGRGVLIDVPRARGIEWLEPGEAIHSTDLEHAERALGVTIREADAVLVRTGHHRRRASTGPWDSGASSAGLHVDAMRLLGDRRPALLGSDGDSDVRPSPTPGIHSPIHVLAITAMGIPLLDNLELEALSLLAADEGRYEFLFVVAPLNVPAGTGSPVNPIAIF